MSRVLQNAKNQITYGYSNKHKAVDVVKYKNKTCNIIAHTDGIVVWIQTGEKTNVKATGNASYGNCVKLKHPNGYYTLYAHLKNVQIKKGEKIKRGHVIGYMGDTGKAFGAHLHFEVRNSADKRIDPTPYLDENLPLVLNYQVFDKKKKKWLPIVNMNNSSFAGNINNSISGLRVSDYIYRVHDKKKKKWLPFVYGLEDYAGNLSNDIDGIQIKEAVYRVHIKGGSWLPWISKVDNTNQGYAGIYGKSIDAIQIKTKK